MSPPVLYPGMVATAVINPMNTMTYKSSTHYAVEIRIDGELFDYEGHLDKDTSLSRYSANRVSGVQESRVRNPDLHPGIWFFGAGNAREWDLTC